jgi:hypothetical protein
MIVDSPTSQNSQINTLMIPITFDSDFDATFKATANIFIPYRTRHVIFHSVASYFQEYILQIVPGLGEDVITEALLFRPESPLLIMSDLFSGSMSPVAFCHDNQVITTYTSILVPDSARKDIRSTYTFQSCGLDSNPIIVPPEATSVEWLRISANIAADNGATSATYLARMIGHVILQIEFRE